MPEQVQAAWLAPALGATGLSRHAIGVVTAIIEAPGATAGEVAKATQMHRNQVYRALRELEDATLVRSERDRPQRFFLASAQDLTQRLEQALHARDAAGCALLEALRRLGAPQAPTCRWIPATAMAAELERFIGRGVAASFDTWPDDAPWSRSAPRQITGDGRPDEGRRVLPGARPLRYLLTSDAGLLFEGPSAFPTGHLIHSPSLVALLQDHFETAWRTARDAEPPRIATGDRFRP